MIVYLDASIILRSVLAQPKAWQGWRQVSAALSSELVEVECLRTLDRLRLANSIDDEELAQYRMAVFALLERMTLIEINRDVLRRAKSPMATVVGTLDAIHLASALLWSESNTDPWVLATHDQQLTTAAKAQGLQCVGC